MATVIASMTTMIVAISGKVRFGIAKQEIKISSPIAGNSPTVESVSPNTTKDEETAISGLGISLSSDAAT